MSDTMKTQPFPVLMRWIVKEFEQNQSIFGIHRSQFYIPKRDAPYAVPNFYGSTLATPVGPAAGPHSQLTQNILSAWLSGARFIELKTVQVMDELVIPRPCIDVEDEGYNVEWSQELKLNESLDEYVKAWALISVLNRLLGWEEICPAGTIFNMSVGYNLEGIKSPSMSRFMDGMTDAAEEISRIRSFLAREFPRFADVEIPAQLTNNVTLSTMHGCPPDEIERIATYLMRERGLHTTVKLNPTLLGKETVTQILHDRLGFKEILVPDSAFEHDLQYPRAIQLIKSLKETAAECGLTFGIKLSNTLALANHRQVLPGEEMYLSGRALYPLTMNLFKKLMHEFDGDLHVSYSAGADAFNVTTILASGALPVTAATDLLKPGGYSRMVQYLENLAADMERLGCAGLDDLAANKLHNLDQAAAESLTNPRYKKGYFAHGLPKVKSGLEFFDCVVAPCMEPCAVEQHVPEYAWWIWKGDYDRALEVILARNPLPAVTGYVCTHLCQTRCTRNDYEETVAIRALKRIAAEKGQVNLTGLAKRSTGRRVAIVGAGPSGMAAACFLALNGVKAVVYETKSAPGGMLRVVPAFRLPQEIIDEDFKRITSLGVEVTLNHPVSHAPEKFLEQGFDAVYVAAGFQEDIPLGIEGEGQGVFAALDFLERARCGEQIDLGKNVVVIGGGDTAMDAARTARRFSGRPAVILYRRTRNEIPADLEELEGALEEGTQLEELVTPKRIIREDGRLIALECLRNRLGEPDASGRRRPVVVGGSEFLVPADAVITAIGQQPALYFLEGSAVSRHRNGSIAVDPATGSAGVKKVFAGGDVVEGPESIIAACGDGRRAAEAICAELGIPFDEIPARMPALSDDEILFSKQARMHKRIQRKAEMLHPERRKGFELIEQTFSDEAAKAEAARCLQCSTYCDKCVEVCPNRANFTFMIEPVRWRVSVLNVANGKLVSTGEELFTAAQTRQIMHLDDFCNECGNCATFCVHHGKPYTEKPRLFLREEDYEKESDNAFFIARQDGGWMMRYRHNGVDKRLGMSFNADEILYEDDWMRVAMKLLDFQVKEATVKQDFSGRRALTDAAEMAVILKGLTQTLAYLPGL